jgi:hypothetical protein
MHPKPPPQRHQPLPHRMWGHTQPPTDLLDRQAIRDHPEQLQLVKRQHRYPRTLRHHHPRAHDATPS